MGVDGLQPSVQLGAQRFGFLGLSYREVLRFADILREVVKFVPVVLVEVDQAKVAFTNRAVRRRPTGVIVRVVPIDGVTVQLAAAEHGGEAAAVDLCGESLDASHLEDGRIEVERDGGGRFDAARFGHTGPESDERHTDAPFVGGALARPVGAVLRDRKQAAVIAGEEDHGIVLEFKSAEIGANRTKRVVDAADERGVGGVTLLERRIGVDFTFVLGDDLRLASKGRVDCVMWQVDEEWTVFVGLHELHGLSGFSISQEFTLRAFG